MKKLILISLSFGFSVCLFSQDIIITQNNESIRVKVLEINETDIKCVYFHNQDGPTYVISKSKIKSIVYENGLVESFDEAANAPVVAANTPAPIINNYVIKESRIKLEDEKEFKNVVRFDPFSTIVLAPFGLFALDVQYARYLTPKIAIPVNLQVIAGGGIGGFTLLSGIEAVPVTHRQKSGLFLNALAGITYLDYDTGFAARANIGYQLVSRKGFAFNVAIGPGYDTITGKVGITGMLSFGFAF